MTGVTAVLRLALGSAPWAPAFRDLFPPGGGFAAAARDLARLPPPDALDLFAYELLERVRDGLQARESRFRAPLWPRALAAAYALDATAALDLAAMLPPLELSRAPDGEAARLDAARAARELGLPPLDAERYAAALAEEARAGGWLPRFAPPMPPREPHRRETSSAVLACDGRILLERRAEKAPVTPNVWDLPGGHFEPGETAEAALARELREELGLSEPRAEHAATLLVAEPPAGVPYRHHIFLAPVQAGEARPLERQRVAWFTPREALGLPDINPVAAYVVQELREAGRLAP